MAQSECRSITSSNFEHHVRFGYLWPTLPPVLFCVPSALGFIENDNSLFRLALVLAIVFFCETVDVVNKGLYFDLRLPLRLPVLPLNNVTNECFLNHPNKRGRCRTEIDFRV